MTRDEAKQLIKKMLILQAEVAYLDRAMPYVFSGRLTPDRFAEKMRLLEMAKQDLIERLTE